MYKKPTNKPIYHIFTDNFDDYLVKNEAIKMFNELVIDQQNARLYSTVWNRYDGIYDDKDCIKTFGSFPK